MRSVLNKGRMISELSLEGTGQLSDSVHSQHSHGLCVGSLEHQDTRSPSEEVECVRKAHTHTHPLPCGRWCQGVRPVMVLWARQLPSCAQWLVFPSAFWDVQALLIYAWDRRGCSAQIVEQPATVTAWCPRRRHLEGFADSHLPCEPSSSSRSDFRTGGPGGFLGFQQFQSFRVDNVLCVGQALLLPMFSVLDFSLFWVWNRAALSHWFWCQVLWTVCSKVSRDAGRGVEIQQLQADRPDLEDSSF